MATAKARLGRPKLLLGAYRLSCEQIGSLNCVMSDLGMASDGNSFDYAVNHNVVVDSNTYHDKVSCYIMKFTC